jgi:hypothetical protein
MQLALSHKLETAYVVWRFLALLDAPTHLHKRRNGNRGVGDRKVATNKHGGLERKRAKDANAAIAEIMDAAIELFWRGARRCASRKQASRAHIEHLWEARKLAPLAIGEIIHRVRSCTKIAPA